MTNGKAQYQVLLQQEQEKLRQLDEWFQREKGKIEAAASKFSSQGIYDKASQIRQVQLGPLQLNYDSKAKLIKANIARFERTISDIEKAERQAQGQ